MEERLNKWLSRMGICSRREADRLIEEGRVLVDGIPAKTGQKVQPGQRIICDGREIAEAGQLPQPPRKVLLAVNKPKGVVCTTSHKDRAENIVDFLNYPLRVYPIGRLDKDSEGLLLMTNQGELVNKIMRARNAHEKEYVVEVDKPVTDAFIKQMSAGVWLPELKVVTRPCRVKRLGERRFSIILTQGLNRQIRRMSQACGCHVIKLTRVRIMNISLGNLPSGSFREIKGEEYRQLIRLLKQDM